MTDDAELVLPPARGRARARTPSRVVAGVVVLLGLLSLLARPLGVSGWPLFAQALSLKMLLGLGFVALTLMVACVAALRGRLRSPVALIVCAALFVTGAVHVGIVLARGGTLAPVADADLVEFNTLDTATSPAQLAELVRSSDADIVTLPEGGEDTTLAAVALLVATGLDFQAFTTTTQGPYPLPLSALVRRSLGEYQLLAGPELRYGSLRLQPVDASSASPTVIAVHPTNPGLRSMLGLWRSETATAARICAPGSNTIVAGDFNATVDHPAFADLPCVDAATQAGVGGSGTWPSSLPAALAAPIDHVILDPRSYRAVAAWTVRTGASDHRALVVQLRRLRP